MTDGKTVRSLRGRPARSAGFPLHKQTFVLNAAVEAGDLSAVTVVKLRRNALACSQNFFARLTTARMRHLRIHIGPIQ